MEDITMPLLELNNQIFLLQSSTHESDTDTTQTSLALYHSVTFFFTSGASLQKARFLINYFDLIDKLYFFAGYRPICFYYLCMLDKMSKNNLNQQHLVLHNITTLSMFNSLHQ